MPPSKRTKPLKKAKKSKAIPVVPIAWNKFMHLTVRFSSN